VRAQHACGAFRTHPQPNRHPCILPPPLAWYLRVGSAIFDSLGAKANAVRTYRIYCTADGKETVAVATLMPGSEGHPGILHGGVTALLFDNTLGWANAVARLANAGELTATLNGKPVNPDTVATFGFTAYLHTNYRAPCPVESTLVLSCSVDRAEGRKLFVSGEARDAATGTLIADSHALFVRPQRRG
jgi:acyl-coenzyme A thioesterase PaaI-like protein